MRKKNQDKGKDQNCTVNPATGDHLNEQRQSEANYRLIFQKSALAQLICTLAVEAATATIRYWIKNKEKIFRNVTALSQHFTDRLSQMKFKKGASLRILGLAIGIEVSDSNYADRIQQKALKKGVLFTAQEKTLTLFPPLTMKLAIAEEGLEILESCL
ncbi:aminotransferase class III-fold pyridoxal phosphate-dependent enzyme [Flavitalea sp.]|nr:aminotransferase class III-fold pyridoxal phosphate-dependent enzyme [Flavitalea sp.]